MREIKFRAWDKVKKEYIYSSLEHAIRFMDIHFNPPYQELPIGFGLSPEEIARFEYEQYTGLKDKNGKEIYEGDIVSAILGTQGCGAINRKERSFNFVINWFKNGFEWSRLSPHDRYRFYPGFDKCEVIGNIHENHELLNVESNTNK